MKTIKLTISPNYVASWGLWQSIRELVQNAYDQRDRDSKCQVTITHNDNVLTISTSTGQLTAKSLLLGESDKTTDANMRGKFGEGYKLALLVLTRNRHKVIIFNADEVWIPKIEKDDDFGCEVLKIDIHEADQPISGVKIQVGGIDGTIWESLYDNIRPYDREDEILFDVEQKGRIYVGGLYVTTIKELHYGYSFRASTVSLDRDRGMVNDFDVRYQTSRLWSQQESDEVYKLLKAEAPDVDYCEHHNVAPVAALAFNYFVKEHGENTIPVVDQNEIMKANDAGVKWALVPRSIFNLLSKIKVWLIPSGKSAVDQLKEFADKYKYSLTAAMKSELNEVIGKLEKQNG